MSHPAYHLRPNKAVDRMLLVDVIRILERSGTDISAFTYYGFGGPYLEEFRLLYEICPQIRMVSIEEDRETFERQKFHLPCGFLRLKNCDFRTFLTDYDPKDKKSVFWLDYTSLTYSVFEELMKLVTIVADQSIVKITVPVDFRHWRGEKEQEFKRAFDAVMPGAAVPFKPFDKFAGYVQSMMRIALEKALPSASSRNYQPVCSFCYSDGTPMLSLTGIVCPDEDVSRFKGFFVGWQFANLEWAAPRIIDVPVLSTKERLHLAKYLPSSDADVGRKLHRVLGYSVDKGEAPSITKMEQYAAYHRYSPYFIRAVP